MKKYSTLQLAIVTVLIFGPLFGPLDVQAQTSDISWNASEDDLSSTLDENKGERDGWSTGPAYGSQNDPLSFGDSEDNLGDLVGPPENVGPAYGREQESDIKNDFDEDAMFFNKEGPAIPLKETNDPAYENGDDMFNTMTPSSSLDLGPVNGSGPLFQ